LFPDEACRVKAAQFLAAHGLEAEAFTVGISVTASKFNKQWPPDRFGELADRLIKRYGARIVWVGSSGDASSIAEAEAAMRRRDRAVSSAGAFTLAELAALLGRLKLFVSVDTGPLYMADAMGVPVVDIAGPADVRSQAPVGRALVIQADGIPPRLTLMAAPDSSERDPAIIAITVDQVWREIEAFISREGLASVLP
ncbi:glycosyltransferase family 9 protein, partial [Candidatus Parcubacteria bacterium]|nr:glycosyltransferase family 9 protein [Candidatus Parcubacteria bacterium]